MPKWTVVHTIPLTTVDVSEALSLGMRFAFGTVYGIGYPNDLTQPLREGKYENNINLQFEKDMHQTIGAAVGYLCARTIWL